MPGGLQERQRARDPPESPRRAKRPRSDPAAGAAAATAELKARELSCPICLELAAFVAKPPCGHVLCWTCSHQLFQSPAGDKPVRCPQCRSELEERQLRSSPEIDALVDRLAAEVLDDSARAEWAQRKKDGAGLYARALAQQNGEQVASRSPVQQAKQRQLISLGYTFSCAPSSRAVCRAAGCKQRIERGRLRLEHSTGFLHAGCHDFQRDLDAACAAERVGVNASSELTVTMAATVQPAHGIRLKERAQWTRDMESLKEQLRATGGNRPWWLTVEMGGNLFASEREEVEEGDSLLRAMDDAMNHSIELFESGDIAAAVAECEGAVDRLRSAFGGTNQHTLHAQLLLANLVAKHGRLSDSVAMYDEVIDQFKQQYGDNNLDTLGAQVDLAHVLTRMDRLHDARTILTAVLREYENQLGDYHEDTMDARHALANLLHEQGQLYVAKTMYETLLEQRSRHDGEQAQVTMGVKMCLANVLMQQGRLEASLELHEEVVGVLTGLLGPQHPDTHSARNNLATVLQQVGKIAEAQTIYESVIKGRTEQLGPNHADTLMAQMNLAILQKEQGDFEQARRLFEVSVRGFVANIGSQHTITLNAQCELFELHAESGGENSLQLAEGLVETLRLLERQDHGSSDDVSSTGTTAASTTTATSGGNMYVAYCKSALGLLKHKQAIALEQKQKQKQKPKQGHVEQDGRSADDMDKLLTAASGLRKDAEALYRSALDTQVALHGANHAYALKTMRRLESLQKGGDNVYCPHPLVQLHQPQAARA